MLKFRNAILTTRFSGRREKTEGLSSEGEGEEEALLFLHYPSEYIIGESEIILNTVLPHEHWQRCSYLINLIEVNNK